MKVIDEDAMREARNRPACECCGRRVWPLEAHHVFVKRGMGGGRRLDLRCNLIGLTPYCHRKAEASKAFNEQLKEIVAKREGTTVEAIKDFLDLVLRTPKESPQPETPWSVAA